MAGAGVANPGADVGAEMGGRSACAPLRGAAPRTVADPTTSAVETAAAAADAAAAVQPLGAAAPGRTDRLAPASPDGRGGLCASDRSTVVPVIGASLLALPVPAGIGGCLGPRGARPGLQEGIPGRAALARARTGISRDHQAHRGSPKDRRAVEQHGIPSDVVYRLPCQIASSVARCPVRRGRATWCPVVPCVQAARPLAGPLRVPRGVPRGDDRGLPPALLRRVDHRRRRVTSATSRRPRVDTNCRSCLSRLLMLSSRSNKPSPLSDERRRWGHAIATFPGFGRSNLLS